MEIYYKSAEAARAAGELEQYQSSARKNLETARAIDAAIAEHFDGWHLAPAALDDVLTGTDPERVALVLALTVKDRAHDGRIRPAARTWADGIRIPEGAPMFPPVCRAHSTIIDGYIAMFRKRTEA